MARAAPRVPRLLRAALLLLLLVAAGRQAAGGTRALRRGGRAPGRPAGTAPLTGPFPAGAPVVAELRCQCLQTVQGIHLKNIQSVKVTPPGPHCAQTEVVAQLKNGQEACLNPAAPMVKRIIEKMLDRRRSSN
ncbi:growth-regulated protein homolog gamma-like isoform X1 [Nycticebus coucang]|uniref:growth-regulated protein homolog gamma-like isoform X1 n=1 Tax=Nycticebus coucang TaxID=9470 RepID=UPI00234CCA85|nr:growth-regulated protein homolog gamma-like isoform X1 [Nycticebus coucang]